MQAGYLKDALKYLTIAQENDPVDFSTMLKLGWVYNVLHDDRDAVKWFDLASKSSDPSISSEAKKAYHNLAPQFQRLRTTVWIFPRFLHALARRLRLRPNQNRAEARPSSHSSLPLCEIRRRYTRDIGPTTGNALPSICRKALSSSVRRGHASLARHYGMV
jgi:hypothetical protein